MSIVFTDWKNEAEVNICVSSLQTGKRKLKEIKELV